MKEDDNYYIIQRADGEEIDPEAIFFILRLDHDKKSRKAVLALAKELEDGDFETAEGLREFIQNIEDSEINQRH